MQASPGLDTDAALGDHEVVPRPAFSSTRGPGHLNIFSIPLPDSDMVYEMPVFTMGVHAQYPVMGREAEDGICDQ